MLLRLCAMTAAPITPTVSQEVPLAEHPEASSSSQNNGPYTHTPAGIAPSVQTLNALFPET
jgi:hypothetical protein